jgi:uncharacterized protein DUF4157
MSKASATTKSANVASPNRSSASLLPQQKGTLTPQLNNGQTRSASSLVRDTVASPGQPLDTSARSLAESHLGYDFSHVRVHTDNEAAQSARAVRSLAYTSRDHVVFGPGQYAPGTPAGQRLLTHELTHVAQQASGPVSATNAEEGLAISHPDDAYEQAARIAAGSTGVDRASQKAPPKQLPKLSRSSDSQIIQRADTDLSAGTSGAVAGASIAGGIGGLASGVAGLVGLAAAFRSAVATERQADAAEFVAAGGFSFDSFAFPEITTNRARSTDAGPAAAGAGSVEQVNESQEISIPMLNVKAGDDNSAEIVLRLQSDGHNFLPGGVIEQGDTVGYGGGVRAANGRLAITSVAASNNLGSGANQVATAAIRFRGENRKPGTPVQRFSGRVIVSAAGAVLFAESTQSVRDSGQHGAASNNVQRQPAVVISLGVASFSDTGPNGALPQRASQLPPPPQQPKTPPGKPKGGGGK